MGSLHSYRIKLVTLNLLKQRRLVRTCIPTPTGELEYSVRLEISFHFISFGLHLSNFKNITPKRLNIMSLCNNHTYLAISFVSKCLYVKYDVDPFKYTSLNSHHKNTLKFCHIYARTDCFKYTVFNRFPAYFDQLPQDFRDQLLFSISGFLMNTKKHFKNLSWN